MTPLGSLSGEPTLRKETKYLKRRPPQTNLEMHFPFGSGLNLFTFIKSKVGQSSAEYFYRIAVTTRITQLLQRATSATLRFTNKLANRLALARKLLLTVALSPLINFDFLSQKSVIIGPRSKSKGYLNTTARWHIPSSQR